MQATGWAVEKVKSHLGGVILCFIKRIPLLPFSIIKVQRFEGQLDDKYFNRLKRKYRVIYSIFEPLTDPVFTEFNLGGSPRHNPTSEDELYSRRISSYLPTKTIIIDLKKSEQELWKDLSENARRIIKRNDGVKIKKTKNLERFGEEWRRGKKIWSWSLKKLKKLSKAFGEKIDFWVSEKDGRWLSGLIVAESKDTAFYFQTWTNGEGRKSGAHYKLVWEAILQAKRKGLAYFDFEGIDDGRFPRRSWEGFSEFKKKFGGKEIIFPGCFGRWL